MTARDSLLKHFIASAGWADAKRSTLAGDASNRRYDRLIDPAKGAAVLMDAPPEKGEDTRPFIAIAEHLLALGLSAPVILARDPENGFLLLEDLGDGLFARVVADNPALEAPLYETATDLLVALHAHPPPPGLPAYDPALMAQLASLPFEWYLPAAGAAINDGAQQHFQSVIEALLSKHANTADVLIQRDYHAENLLWLPSRDGLARVGLLDFQDAMSGHRAYDLVSALEDARRDVPAALQEQMLARYITQTGVSEAPFRTAFAVLGAQRNLRILGVFARLCVRDGKAHYVDLIPRVWGHLMHDLRHPALAELRGLVNAFPAPTPSVLQRIKDQCAQRP